MRPKDGTVNRVVSLRACGMFCSGQWVVEPPHGIRTHNPARAGRRPTGIGRRIALSSRPRPANRDGRSADEVGTSGYTKGTGWPDSINAILWSHSYGWGSLEAATSRGAWMPDFAVSFSLRVQPTRSDLVRRRRDRRDTSSPKIRALHQSFLPPPERFQKTCANIARTRFPIIPLRKIDCKPNPPAIIAVDEHPPGRPRSCPA